MSSNATEAEPDFTPLLDVVLQLLMFFIMVVRFVPTQAGEMIKLPSATEGHLVEAADKDAIFLNLRPYDEKFFKERYSPSEWANFPKDRFNEGDPCIIVFSDPGWPYTLATLKRKLAEDYEQAESRAKGGEISTVIIIRADENTAYSTIYTLLKDCKTVGFRKLKLRAFKATGV
jgi:biopolymer transport protein ExbD